MLPVRPVGTTGQTSPAHRSDRSSAPVRPVQADQFYSFLDVTLPETKHATFPSIDSLMSLKQWSPTLITIGNIKILFNVDFYVIWIFLYDMNS